jgi:hypothetical protein
LLDGERIEGNDALVTQEASIRDHEHLAAAIDTLSSRLPQVADGLLASSGLGVAAVAAARLLRYSVPESFVPYGAHQKVPTVAQPKGPIRSQHRAVRVPLSK